MESTKGILNALTANQLFMNFPMFSFILFPLKEVNDYILKKNQSNSFLNKDGTLLEINLNDCFDYDKRLIVRDSYPHLFCSICKCNTVHNEVTKIYFRPSYIIIILDRGKGATFNIR